MAPPILEFDVAWSHFDVAQGNFDVAWQKLWLKNDVFDEILGCAGHLTSPEKKWASVAIRIFYKYGWGVGGRHTILVEYFYGDGSPLFLR